MSLFFYSFRKLIASYKLDIPIKHIFEIISFWYFKVYWEKLTSKVE